MKKIISFFSVVIIMVAVCTTSLTDANAIDTFSFTIRSNIPGAPENDITDRYSFYGNKCELTITNMVNCNVMVISSTLNNSPITIYSPGSYHLTFTTYSFRNLLSLELIPIDQNLPSYCSGYFSTT